MTHAEFEHELVEALNMLLEDERASVEMEIALASGATEYAEREALTAMGVEDIHFCAQLRSEMEAAGLPVTPQINGVVFRVLGADRYDDRLRAFALHQRVVSDHARELQESNLDGPLREALEGISATHDRHSAWTEQQAEAFAATRELEFGPAGQSIAASLDETAPADGEVYTISGTITNAASAPVAEPAAESELAAANVAQPAAIEELPEERQPKPRATRATPAKAKAPAKPKTSAAKPKAEKAKPAAKASLKANTADEPAPRRTRRASTQPATDEA